MIKIKRRQGSGLKTSLRRFAGNFSEKIGLAKTFPGLRVRAVDPLLSASAPGRAHGGIPPEARSGRRKAQFPHPLVPGSFAVPSWCFSIIYPEFRNRFTAGQFQRESKNLPFQETG